MAEKAKSYIEDVDISLVITIAVVSIVLVYVSIVAMSAWYFRYERVELEKKAVSQRYESLINLQTEQLERINTYRWIDEKGGILAIPIDRAVEITVNELSRDLEEVNEKEKNASNKNSKA